MDLTILLIGNGFEANFNNKMTNFNEKFEKWILDTSDGVMENFIKNIYSDLYGENSANISYIQLTRELVQLIKSFYKDAQSNSVSNIQIEDVLNQIAQKYKAQYLFDENDDKIMEIFRCLKNLLGHYIYLNTVNECENYKSKYQAIPESVNRPNVIMTTNYTESANYLLEKFVSSLSSPNIKVFYIHGKFDIDKNDLRYDDIQINLGEKNVFFYFNQLFDLIKIKRDKISKINFEIFGHNLANDPHIYFEIIKLYSKIGIGGKIDYHYFDDSNFSDIFNLITKVTENSELANLLNGYFEFRTDKNNMNNTFILGYSFSGIEKFRIEFNLVDYEMHYLFTHLCRNTIK